MGSFSIFHSSATFDNNYFLTAALWNNKTQGIEVQYTSKREFDKSFDSVNKKYNSRVVNISDTLAGYFNISGNGSINGELGGILYFEKYNLYCLVYAKTPNYSNDSEKNGTNIIFITTWNFENNKISNNITYEIKIFDKDIEKNFLNLRAGKYGDDKIIILYNEVNNENQGNLNKGTIPKVIVVNVTDMKIIIYDKIYNNLFMNTNEDLRTFRDGVLIWGSTNKDGKLVINKIGTGLLDNTDEDMNIIITKEDIENYKKKRDEDEKEEENKPKENEIDSSLGTTAIILISIGSICLVVIIIIIIYCLIKRNKSKNKKSDEGVFLDEISPGKLVE